MRYRFRRGLFSEFTVPEFMRKRSMLTVAQTTQKYLKFYGRKVECTRKSNFGDYPGGRL